MLEPESAWSTAGSASKSLTLEMELDLRSATTWGGGRGWEEAVPQLTPMATDLEVDSARLRKRGSSFSSRGEDGVVIAAIDTFTEEEMEL